MLATSRKKYSKGLFDIYEYYQGCVSSYNDIAVGIVFIYCEAS